MFHREWLRSLPLRLVGAFKKCPAPRRRRTPEFRLGIEHLENLVLLGDTVPMLVASVLGDSPVPPRTSRVESARNGCPVSPLSLRGLTDEIHQRQCSPLVGNGQRMT